MGWLTSFTQEAQAEIDAAELEIEEGKASIPNAAEEMERLKEVRISDKAFSNMCALLKKQVNDIADSDEERATLNALIGSDQDNFKRQPWAQQIAILRLGKLALEFEQYKTAVEAVVNVGGATVGGLVASMLLEDTDKAETDS